VRLKIPIFRQRNLAAVVSTGAASEPAERVCFVKGTGSQFAEKLGFEIGRDFSPGNNGLQINVGFSPWDMLFPAFSPQTDFFRGLFTRAITS
jgi:hypothetical protein